VKFLLVGGGTRAAEIHELASGLESVRVLPLLEEERVPEVLAAADVSLVPLRQGLSRLSVPSKIYSIVASGRAVGSAVDPGSEVERIVREADCGFAVPPGDAQALAREILLLAGDRGRAIRCGKNARTWAEMHGNLDRAADAYESVLMHAAAIPSKR
jgi:colanic acid biosynthesis glycosyl transferase WcaI